MNSNQTTPTQPRTQRFYCPGCREWHEAPALLEAVRAETERMRLEEDHAQSDTGSSDR